jgi:zinc transporter
LVSVRNQPLRSVDRLRMAVNSGAESFATPLELVIHLLRDQADVLAGIIRDATDKVDRIEDDFLVNRLPKRAQLGQLRRDLVRLQRLLAPEPGALLRLLNRPPAWMGDAEAQDLRLSTEEFSLVLRDMAALQERVKLLQEEVGALIGERTNRNVFVLTAVTAIALPINLTAGLFGMNVGGIPLNQDPAGFWYVLMFAGLITGLAAWWLFRSLDE